MVDRYFCLIVIDLAVVDDRDTTVFVEKWLLSGRNVDDRQATMAERDAGFVVLAASIRATMQL